MDWELVREMDLEMEWAPPGAQLGVLGQDDEEERGRHQLRGMQQRVVEHVDERVQHLLHQTGAARWLLPRRRRPRRRSRLRRTRVPVRL